MPLYMDRHDLPGVTREQVAAAHNSDMAIESRFGVQFLTYWFDADAGEVFCLAKARRADDMQSVHRESHGLVPNEIIAVSEDNVLRFLGKIVDPSDPANVTSAFRTILFTDLEGSTALLHEVGEAGFMVLLTEHDLIVRRALVAAHGREVKHTGDGIMASFDDGARALACAAAIQVAFAARNAGGASPALHVRIGMAAGEPVDHNDDMFGSTVNLAARLTEAGTADGVLVSATVRDLGVKAGYAFDDAGALELKGFPEPTPAFVLRRAQA